MWRMMMKMMMMEGVVVVVMVIMMTLLAPLQIFLPSEQQETWGEGTASAE